MHGYLKDKKTLKNCRVYGMLKKAARKKHSSFHTPGHKVGKWDLTELSFSDNLASPSGCILAAQEELALLVGAKKSFILTDGSTSGVLSMLYAAKLLGVKTVALSAFSHKSAFNGCKALGLKTKIVSGETTDGYFAPITLKEMLPALEKADAAFVTSPTYYGDFAELKELREYCDEKGKLLIVDSAHGGHLRFDKEKYAGTYAHLWVDGVHKSLPAFTQGALVSACGEREAAALEEAVNVFRTSSPSYPIMASVEYAVKYPRNERLEEAVLDFIEENAKSVHFGGDWTKLCVCFDNPKEVASILERKGIYPEFYDGSLVCFYLSPATKMSDFKRLKKQLQKLSHRFENWEKKDQKCEKRSPAPLKIKETDVEYVDLSESEGRICAKECGLFPPCVPLVLAGEKITEETVRLLKNADSTFGLQEKKIAVLKEEKL